MNNDSITKILIVGGGTAGWMTAAAMAKVIGCDNCAITLVESDTISTVGVGEATIPPIVTFNELLGIDSHEMLKATQGTFKLGIEFSNWGKIGDRYMHPFGSLGTTIKNIGFHHFWKKAYELGLSPGLEAYSLNALAARSGRFYPAVKLSPTKVSSVVHAYHFDANLYGQYLRKFSTSLGVKRIEGVVKNVELNGDTGFIDHIHMADGQVLSADFFIDCTGFRGLLIEKTLKTGYENWSQYLPCNRAVALPTQADSAALPYTQCTAHGFGWEWRIPLQHRTGNGFVYSDSFIDDQAAAELLLNKVDGARLAEPKHIRFVTGRRKMAWNRNCLAVGLSGGFLEPLESTSIHLIQSAISRFLGLFPRKADFNAEMARFNKLTEQEYISIRDFLILHYKATTRNDTAFWDHCRTMAIPSSLQDKLDLYQSSSGLYRDNNELFSEASWLAVLEGQGVVTQRYHPLVDVMPLAELEERLAAIRAHLEKAVSVLPEHEKYIAQYC